MSSLPPIPTLESNLINAVNRYRTSRGLNALIVDNRISNIARQHSINMANGLVPFGHTGFDRRVAQIGTFLQYNAVGENVAFNRGYQAPSAQAYISWINSPSHLSNIVGRYNRTGLGIARNGMGTYYFTQIFVNA